jgi:hypothetical protein
LTIFFLLGFTTSAQIITYPLIAESNPGAIVGSAEGLASVLIMAGGFTQPFFAWLMELHWNHQIVNDLPVYSSSDYRLALCIMPIAFFLGLIMSCLIRETRCKPYHAKQTPIQHSDCCAHTAANEA